MRSSIFALALTLAVAGLGAPAAAHADTFAVDASHSEVGFKVRHNTISWVHGQFGEFEVAVEFDPADVAATTIEATIQIASVDTDHTKRDEHLRGADFFDAATFPTMTYKSTKVRKITKDGFEVVGDLTMHGVTQEVVLAVDTIPATITDPWGNVRTGTSATTRIDRKDFGVSWSKIMDNGGLVVGDDIHITLDIELIKAK